MDVENPRRIMFVGAPDSGVLPLLHDLTGSTPEPRVINTPHTQYYENKSNNDPTPATYDSQKITTAGLTHSLALRTKYYNADLPIWIDEVPDVAAWKDDFLSEEAKEVVEAVGAWILVFRRGSRFAGTRKDSVEAPKDQWEKQMSDERRHASDLMQAVKQVIEYAHGRDGIWDGTCLVVGMPGNSWDESQSASSDAQQQSSNGDDGRKVAREMSSVDIVDADHAKEDADEGWEVSCFELGFEYVHVDSTFGSNSASTKTPKPRPGSESGPTGVARIREALETTDWEAGPEDEEDDGPLLANDLNLDEDPAFGLERDHMKQEFMGLKMSKNSEDDTNDAETEPDEVLQVDELERMMVRLNAVKDMTAHLPEQQRKKAAAKAVNDIMKDVK